MKKFFLFLLAVICVACMGAAAACAPEGDFYLLVFRQTNGVHYNSDIPSGVEVKAGTEVKFSLTLDENATGTPTVYKNDDLLEADGDGVYSFVIEEATTVKVMGVDAPGDYNRVIFRQTPGVEVNFETTSQIGENQTLLQNGMLVKKGTEVKFRVAVKEGYYVADGTDPVVSVNGTVLTPENGVYTFVVDSVSEISVTGVTKNLNVVFGRGDTRVDYIAEDESLFTTDEAVLRRLGDKVRFKVKPSVYYKAGDFEVRANTTILKPDDNGFYEFVVEDDTNISVNGLEQDSPFTDRENCGTGTEKNPFRISRPIDLYQMAALVNSSFYIQEIWRTGYYVLENDIDMQGEQLFIIGTLENNLAYFAGHFEGNGHKISNFYIVDTFIEQENYNTMVVRNIGLFGTARSLNGSVPTISNLRLEDYNITADASPYTTRGYDMSVGSIVGEGFGVNIINCSVDTGIGSINVTGGINPAYVGGIIGQQVSYSEESPTRDSVSLESRIVGCTSKARIRISSSEQMLTYAVGGISGLTGVGEREVSSYIINSSFTGDINGGIHAGGITGYLSQYSSVVNCYSSGAVRAYSPFNTSANSAYFNSYAGGIAGLVEYDSVVYGCFVTGSVTAGSANSSAHNSAGDIAGLIDGTNGDKLYGYSAGLTINSSRKQANEITNDFIRQTLKWREDDWTFTEGSLPVINPQGATKTQDITITLNAEADFGGNTAARTSKGYKSMAEWAGLSSNSLPEYLAGNNGSRSYGYFFDAEKTKKVPIGFAVLGDITLYVGSANYKNVEGTYYIGDLEDAGAKITLNSDGTFDYRNGPVSQSSIFTYDGQNIVLLNSVIGTMTKTDLQNNDSTIFSRYYHFGAKTEGDSIEIRGGDTNLTNSTTNQNIVLFPEDAPLTGLKEHEGFRYGDYYDNSNGRLTRYTFNGNGTGRRVVTGSSQDTVTGFTFVYTDNSKITVTYNGGSTEEVTYADNIITQVGTTNVKPYDVFAGTWEAEFGIDRTYTFDGMGKWTSGSGSGQYTIEENGGSPKLKDNGNAFTAVINDDGFVEVTLTADSSSLTYYREGSFKGEWYFSAITQTSSSISVTLKLEGLGAEGYGNATAVYGSGEVLDLNYSTVEANGAKRVEVFLGELVYTELAYDSEKLLLSGTVEGLNARFAAFDALTGTWIADGDTIKTLNFNGNGFYNIDGNISQGIVAIKGYVQVNERTRVQYTLDRKTLKGKFTYSGVEYDIAYDADKDSIKVTHESDVDLTLQQLDEWYGRELTDGKGTVYSFDGRGKLTNGGTVFVTVNGAPSLQYTYKIEADNKITLNLKQGGDVSEKYTISVETKSIPEDSEHQVYVFKKEIGSDGETLLYRNTPFNGEWIIGGVGGTLTISNIYADDTATGSYNLTNGEHNENVQFKYNVEGNYLSFTYKDEVTYYINAVNVGNGYNLSFGPENKITSQLNSTCIPATRKDEWRDKVYYVYNPETKQNTGRLVFDGLGGSNYSTGSVIYFGFKNSTTDIDPDNIIATHSYNKSDYGYGNKLYHYARITDNYYEYLLIPCKDEHSLDGFRDILYYLRDDGYAADGENTYGDHYFAVVYPDELYNETIRDLAESNVYYFFDGVGGVTRYTYGDDSSAEYFTYRLVEINTETFIHKLEFTDDEGTVYNVTLNQSETDNEDAWRVEMD